MVKKKKILVLIIAICSLSIVSGVFLSKHSSNMHTPNMNIENDGNISHDDVNKKVSNIKKEIPGLGIVLSVENCPKTAEQGQNVTVTYVVSNKGTKPIYNLIIFGQKFNKGNEKLGTLGPGKTINIPYTVHISTNEELKEDFGQDAKMTNPYPIGGNTLTFKDSKGVKHTLYFPIYKIVVKE